MRRGHESYMGERRETDRKRKKGRKEKRKRKSTRNKTSLVTFTSTGLSPLRIQIETVHKN